MRNAHLINDVDAREKHAQDARDRARAARRLQAVGIAEPQTAPKVPGTRAFWERIKRYFPQPEVLTVGGRVIEKGFVVTPAMGLTICLALASALGVGYNRLSGQIEAKDKAYQEQRDMLIEIRTELRMTKEHDAEARAELKRQIGDLYAWQQVTNKDLARVIPGRPVPKQPQP